MLLLICIYANEVIYESCETYSKLYQIDVIITHLHICKWGVIYESFETYWKLYRIDVILIELKIMWNLELSFDWLIFFLFI